MYIKFNILYFIIVNLQYTKKINNKYFYQSIIEIVRNK